MQVADMETAKRFVNARLGGKCFVLYVVERTLNSCVTRHTWDCSAIALLPTKCDQFAKRMNILRTVYHCLVLVLLPLLLGLNVLRLCIIALILHRSRVCVRDLHSRPPTHRPGSETISVLCSQASHSQIF